MFIPKEHEDVVEKFLKRLGELVTSEREIESPDEFTADSCDRTHRLTIQGANEVKLPGSVASKLRARFCCSCEVLLNTKAWIPG